jgi:hypothetical protein
MSPNAQTPLTTPVLFIIFNRPETTQQVFDAIRTARPTRLYIAADGARENKEGENLKCQEARMIASSVDWDCEVHTLFRNTNLGCGRGVSGAITWFFENETEGIILEDDCLPSPSFFTFCAEMLTRYRDDTRVMQIGGNNFELPETREKEYSYRFSTLTYIWGWATWRRAWKHHDFQMTQYKEINKKGYLLSSYDTIFERDFFQYVFDEMYSGAERTWDYQWLFACRINSGLIIVPQRNLVRNLGFGMESTNTSDPNGLGYDLQSEKIEFPLKHPEFVMADQLRDRQAFLNSCTSVPSRVRSRIKNIIPSPVFEKVVKPLMHFFY